MKTSLIIIASVAILATLTVLPYRELFANATGRTRAPHEVAGFSYIPDNADPRFVITRLVGVPEAGMWMTPKGEYIINTRHDTPHDGIHLYYYKLSPGGRLISRYELPEKLFFRRGYILGPGTWCDWLISGDTTTRQAVPIEGNFNRETLRPYYQRASAAYFLYDYAMLLLDGEWRCATIDFSPEDSWSSKEEYREKGKLLKGDQEYPDYIYADYEPRPGGTEFKEFPASDRDFTLLFFEKKRYVKGGTYGTGMNPTGFKTISEHWAGTAYFRLDFGSLPFEFKYDMDQEFHFDRSLNYRLPFSIWKRDGFALMRSDRYSYLIYVPGSDEV